MEDERVMIIFYYDKPGSTEEPKRICSFRTYHFAEWLKLFTYAKKHEIDFWPRTDDEGIPDDILEQINGIGGYVKDVSVSFGSDMVIQCIEVILGV